MPLPTHIAIIMDGNGRWAKQQGLKRVMGHHYGVKAVRESVERCAELGIKYLTLYAFSTENWNRPIEEVNALMELLVSTISGETKTMMDNNVRLETIGNIASLPHKCQAELTSLKLKTNANTGLTLVLALSYSARWEITEMVKKAITDAKTNPNLEITDEYIAKSLNTSFMPDPELLIRTSGEYRISNFLLWQIAYTELYFTDVLWPDFRKNDIDLAIANYNTRERRFGKTSEQV